MANTIQVQVRIERESQYGTVHDALYFPAEEFFDSKSGARLITDEQIEVQAQQRVAGFEQAIEDARAKPPEPEPTQDQKFESVVASLSEDDQVLLKEWLIAKETN